MRLAHALFACASLIAASAAAACSGGIANVGDGTDGGPGTDSATSAVDGGDASTSADASLPPVVTDDATKVVADTASGGFVPAPPKGSACLSGAQHYELDLTTRTFAFQVCTEGATPTDPYTLWSGSRVLDAQELASARAALAQVTPARSQSSCGTDKGILTLSVTRPQGTTLYYDSFYACQGGKLYVDNLDAPFTAFHQLVPPTK